MKNKADIIRQAFLGIILVFVMIISYLHIHSGPAYPSIHAICPFGGIENLWAWLAGRANLQKLFTGTMTLFFFVLFFSLLFGRTFCGYICPFGALQEFFGKISKKKFSIPKKADKYLRLLKYIILVFAAFMAWITVSIWISPYDPYVAFAHIWSGGELFKENGIGFVILIVVISLSVFIPRFFCRYLCPTGALYGIISKLSPFRVKREACADCGQCSKDCPMDVAVDKLSTVSTAECISCGKCIGVCPSKNNALSMSLFGKKIKPLVFSIAAIIIFFGSITVLDVFGYMQVTVPTIENIEQSGDYLKIPDLRGSMTIEQGAVYAGMALTEFYKVMNIPETVPKDTLLKNVRTYVPGYDFHLEKSKH